MISKIAATFDTHTRRLFHRVLVSLLGILTIPLVVLVYLRRRAESGYGQTYALVESRMRKDAVDRMILEDAIKNSRRKCEFFGQAYTRRMEKKDFKVAEKRFAQKVTIQVDKETSKSAIDSKVTFFSTFSALLQDKHLFPVFAVLALPLIIWLSIMQHSLSKYILQRVAMMLFVVLGVITLVFTILYVSPMKPAINLLGEQATQAQIDSFNEVHGLDQPYIVQLGRSIKNIFKFDLGKSFKGNEDISFAIAQKFPTTLKLSVFALFIALAIAIPAGIISAMRQYSSSDYIFMFFALIGLSIPNFWLGLIFILLFSINLRILPATFVPGQLTAFIMPAIVLGTGLSAAVARMTRSSILEVKGSDFVVTAKAKGLKNKNVVMRHILKNAMIPIITVVGLQFGGMLGGASVVEKVFNMNGLGSYIVDKQFIPDTPVVLVGVVYIAVVISLVNLIVDIAYSFLDPRIKH